jgi:hypothetical protein
MPRILALALLALLVLTAMTPAQSPGLNGDPYRIVYPHYYWGYGPLTDAGNAIVAQGQFLMDMERTKLLREQVRQEKLVSRKKELEHWAWEREFIPRQYEIQRQRAREHELRRTVNEANQQEIFSGAALNALLKALKDNHKGLLEGQSEDVNAAWLDHVHVASPLGGNAGLLKNKDDKLDWPLLVMVRDDLAEERTQIEAVLAQAKSAVRAGQRPAKLVDELNRRVDALTGRLRGEVRSGSEDASWSPGQYVAAIRQLKDLKDASVMLDQKNAAEYLNPLKGNTVAALVAYMKDNGLTFAGATWGDERYYSALFEAMRNEAKRIGAVPALSSMESQPQP